MTLAAALIAFAGAAALLVVTAPGNPGVRPPAPLAVVSSGLRVRLIAIDGVDPGVLDELARTGRIPRVAAALTGTRARLSLQDTDTIRDPARGLDNDRDRSGTGGARRSRSRDAARGRTPGDRRGR